MTGSRKLLLGVDIGTYESKGVLTNPDGEVISQIAIPHKMSIPRAGWAEQDAEEVWWGDFCQISKKLIEAANVDPSEIKAVSVSAIGPDVLPVDENFNPLRMGILYGVDSRAYKEIDELNELYGEEVIYKFTANNLSTQSTGPKILWIKKNEPEIYDKARWFVGATTYIVAKLTGEIVIDHLTAGMNVPLYDPSKKAWSDKFSERIVSIEKLPKLMWTSEIAGKVNAFASDLTGLAIGTPVTVGTVDAAAEALSVGVIKPGEMMLMYGSTIFMIQITDNENARDKRLWAAPYLFPGTWCLLAGMSTSGSLTRWFRDNFAKDLIEVEEKGGENAYAALTKEAEATTPGSAGLITLPYFSGERTPIMDPKARGVIFGLSLHHTRGHLFRSVLEGMGYGVKQHVELFTRIGARPNTIRAVGGGTKNKIWLQSTSDISGVPQEVAPRTFGASYGDALLAGVAIGLVKGPEEILSWQGDFTNIEPDVEKNRLYEPLSSLYSNIYESTKESMHEIHDLGN